MRGRRRIVPGFTSWRFGRPVCLQGFHREQIYLGGVVELQHERRAEGGAGTTPPTLNTEVCCLSCLYIAEAHNERGTFFISVATNKKKSNQIFQQEKS